MRRLTALLVAAPLMAAAGTAPQPAGRWGVTVDDYPPAAMRSRLQGTTRFEITVDPDGKATGCTIIKSSGHAELDEQACAVLLRRARFKPARDEAGNPVAGTWRHLVIWTPGNSGPPPGQPGYAGYGVTVSFGDTGDVLTCKVVPLSPLAPVTAAQAGKCSELGTAQAFADLLGRPTQGLATATYRFRAENRAMGAPLQSGEPIQRTLAHVEIDRTADGAITWCDVKVAPITAIPGMTGTDLCSPQAFGVTRSGGGGNAEHLIYDVVAKP